MFSGIPQLELAGVTPTAPSTLVCVLIVAVTVFLAFEIYTFLRLRHIPGPRFASSATKQWLVRKALGDRYHLDLKQVSDKYGPLARIGADEVLCTDPETLRRMSGVRSRYTKGRFYEGGRFRLGIENLVSMRDEKGHKELREKTRPAFANHPEVLEKGVDKQLVTLVQLIETKYLPRSSASNDGKTSVPVPVDFSRLFQYLALDVISELSFSGAFGFLRKDEDLYKCIEINEAGLKFMSWAVTVPCVANLFLRWPFNRLIPSEGDEVGFGRLMGLISEIIKPRLGAEDQVVRKDDMLQACIDVGMNEAELAEMAFLFIVAGADSSAYAMTMILLNLVTNPRTHLALQSEIDGALASGAIHDSSEPVTEAEAKSLPYLQAVLREGFRMFPPFVGLASKQVPPEGDVVNGYFVPGGTQVGHNTFGVGRLKSFWGEDADVFRPERWLEAGFGTTRGKEMQAVLDLNFGWGKYQCLGKNVAMMELNKVFVELLRRFDIDLVNPTSPIKVTGVPFMVAKDFWVVVSRRKGKE